MSKRDIISAVLIDSDDDELDITNIIIKKKEKSDKNEEEMKEGEMKEGEMKEGEIEQEEMKEEEIKTKRKRIVKPSIALNTYFNENPDIIEIGVDEVGRGPLFGRVYASAVILPKSNDFKHNEMKDSKKFSSKKKIDSVAQYIKQNAIAWSIRYEDEITIDRINILQATQLAMHNCITDILHQLKEKNSELNLRNIILLIDGNYFKPFTNFNPITNKFETIIYHTIEQGDNKFTSIAAASILAKVERDKYIEELCEENPELKEKYKIDSNKGYGSKHHLDGIKTHGITKWHRKTFGICKNYF
jgi:ribonuclease HII